MNTIIRYLFSFSALTCCLSPLTTAQASVALSVYDSNGQQWAVIVLEEKPTVTFVEKGLHIMAGPDDNRTIDFVLPFEKGGYFTFTEAETTNDIEEVIEEKDNPQLFRFEFMDGNTVVIGGLGEKERVSVFSIDGKIWPVDIERTDHTVTAHLNTLPRGCYIIKTEKQSFKIYKK